MNGISKKILNRLENKVIFEGDEKSFIHFVRQIAVENEDEDMSIISYNEAKEYIEIYCDNLEMSN
jgi:hypothetical protein